MIRKTLLFALICVSLASCIKRTTPDPGPWLGVIVIDSADASMQIPFNMNFINGTDGQKVFELTNAGETIMINEWGFGGDTVYIRFPVFQAEIVAVQRNDSMEGTYYPKGKENGAGYRFYALKGVTDRFPWHKDPPLGKLSGRWKITENAGTPDSAVMIGEFTQDSSLVTGTILSTGGDYRYLEGKISGNKFMLSAVDGAHTLILTADITPAGTLENGRFMGSPKWKSTWRAERNDTIRLPEMNKLVWLKKDACAFAFAFPDANGDTVSLSDPKFSGKVVIVQAAGTWCPNCMDEVVFYRDVYEQYRDKGLEIVALCFEEKTFEASKPRIERFVAQTGAAYPFLYAGPRGRESIRSVFYPVDGQLAYPTTLFIDRRGNIRRVETGFTGPGTGSYYQQYASETTQFIEFLLSEK
jgi:peroxiredoxin